MSSSQSLLCSSCSFAFLGEDFFSDCRKVGQEYEGSRDYTSRGVTCQAWNVNTPHTVSSRKHSYTFIFNYLLSMWLSKLFFLITKMHSKIFWSLYRLTQIFYNNLYLFVVLEYHYLASESNYCRIADEPDPWCYTTDNATRWDWCSVPYCCKLQRSLSLSPCLSECPHCLSMVLSILVSIFLSHSLSISFSTSLSLTCTYPIMYKKLKLTVWNTKQI